MFISDTSAQKPDSARVLRHDATGAAPILRPAAIRAANVGEGLNVLILHYAERRTGYDTAQRFMLAHKTLETFICLHRAYKLKQVLRELCDEIGLPYIQHSFAPVLTDYSDY